MKNLKNILFASFIIGSLVLSPVFVGAHKDDDDSDSRKEDRIERRIAKQTEKFEKKQQNLAEKFEKKQQKLEEKFEKKFGRVSDDDGEKCFTSWGHLIAFGWLKKNSSSEVELKDCRFPFGIWKKFGHHKATTTPPLISATSTTVGTSTINVSWTTNEAATSKVYYSTTTPINLSLSNFVQSGSFVTSHSLDITNLATSTLYYMLIESKDAATNTATSSEFATTTLSE